MSSEPTSKAAAFTAFATWAKPSQRGWRRRRRRRRRRRKGRGGG
jgi:hypothetical protein